MEAFCGTWEDVEHDNLPLLLEAAGMTKEEQGKFKEAKVFFDISLEGKDVRSRIYTNTGISVNNVFTIGKECPGKSLIGRNILTTITFSDGKFHESHKHVDYPGQITTVVREISEDGDMKCVMNLKGLIDNFKLRKVK